MGAERRSSTIDAAIARLAERQHGVVARHQILRLGIGRRAIGHRLECGRLHVLHRGVFAVGHRVLTREGGWMAAVLAIGPGAALSHRSAAAMWGLRVAAGARTDVTVARKPRARAGIALHHAVLAPDEVTVVRGITVTTPPRTLLDLAGIVATRHLERAVNDAETLRLTDALSPEDLILRHPRSRGVPALRRILADGRVGATVTRSELEDRFLAFVDRADLPRPEVNTSLALADSWVEVDCLWPPAPRRRARRLHQPRHAHGLRARSRPRPDASGRRLARDSCHLAPPDRRPRHDRRAAAHPARPTTRPSLSRHPGPSAGCAPGAPATTSLRRAWSSPASGAGARARCGSRSRPGRASRAR
jgi:hypothetical protein